MIVRAPGKLVLSGAYAVLEGAPALVAAVDRFVLADSERVAERVTEEVQAALDAHVLDRAVWFDAAALRSACDGGGASRKLGVGSSAAILVATLAARAGAAAVARGASPAWDPDVLFAAAFAAHRRAQGGGSGVDVAASVYGGVLCCQLDAGFGAEGAGRRPAAPSVDPRGALAVTPHALPRDTVVEVFASDSAARTSEMLERVRALAAREPAAYRALIGAAFGGAQAAVASADVQALTAALDRQVDALAELGDRAGAPIVTAAVRRLRRAAATEGAVLAPSGAGGGDVSIFVGGAPPSAAFVSAARAEGLVREPMSLAAPGVHVLDAARTPTG